MIRARTQTSDIISQVVNVVQNITNYLSFEPGLSLRYGLVTFNNGRESGDSRRLVQS